MKEIILLKLGEASLKGLNRPFFEKRLIKNVQDALSPLGLFFVHSAQSTIYVEPKDNADIKKALEILSRVFGISALCAARVCEKDIEDIKQSACEYLAGALSAAQTFKVNAKRADKKFIYNSPQICAYAGAAILEKFPYLKVDVHNPQVSVTVEVREKNAYIRGEEKKGAGGLPAGTSGKATLLLSGGIDSPVSGYLTAKRGVALNCVYFHSHPYTSDRAKQKVIELAEILARYTGKLRLFVVPFTGIQEEIERLCPPPYFTIIMRRFMMRIAQSIAKSSASEALVTGESIGQVASQTLKALNATNSSVEIPVFRPLIAMDKLEIIDLARKIGTFETSILPYEDCCSVFSPKHPCLNPRIEEILKLEQKFEDYEDICQKAAEMSEIIKIT